MAMAAAPWVMSRRADFRFHRRAAVVFSLLPQRRRDLSSKTISCCIFHAHMRRFMRRASLPSWETKILDLPEKVHCTLYYPQRSSCSYVISFI
jgi:hypothetical protein